MNVLLAFPPYWDPTGPSLGLPSMAAVLRARGHNVTLLDVNLETLDYFLSGAGLAEAKSIARRRPQNAGPASEWIRRSASYVIDNIDDAVAALRDPDRFFDFAEYPTRFKLMYLGLQLWSEAFSPARFGLNTFDMGYSPFSSREIAKAVEDEYRNPFVAFFRRRIVPQVLDSAPDVVGISIIDSSQIIPGLTLASELKRRHPGLHICLGGGVITRWAGFLPHCPELFSLLDSAVVYEGETTFSQFLEALGQQEVYAEIPNLLYRCASGMRATLREHVEDLDSLPTPDFEGMPLGRYFAPATILPLLTSRGCWWAQCAFCSHHRNYPPPFRMRSVERLLDDFALLAERHGTALFNLVDEALLPATLKKLAAMLPCRGLEIEWFGESRLAADLTEDAAREIFRSGCRVLLFGLESANDSVLRRMSKGITRGQAQQTLANCARAGLWNHVYILFGFPGETLDEARQTMRFVREHRHVIHSVLPSRFSLDRLSPVCESPAAFGVEIQPSSTDDLPLFHDYRTLSGLQHAEAERLRDEFEAETIRFFPSDAPWSALPFYWTHRFLFIRKYLATRR